MRASSPGRPKSFDNDAGDVEALDHEVVHFAGKVIGFAGDGLNFAAPEARGENKDRQQHEGAQGDAPGEEEHRAQNQKNGDEIADDVGEDVSERGARALHIGIETAYESSGLGAEEEPRGMRWMCSKRRLRRERTISAPILEDRKVYAMPSAPSKRPRERYR